MIVCHSSEEEPAEEKRSYYPQMAPTTQCHLRSSKACGEGSTVLSADVKAVDALQYEVMEALENAGCKYALVTRFFPTHTEVGWAVTVAEAKKKGAQLINSKKLTKQEYDNVRYYAPVSLTLPLKKILLMPRMAKNLMHSA